MIAKAPQFWLRRGLLAMTLLPVAQIFRGLAASRRAAYRHGFLAQRHVGVPTIVVGNIDVGGTGKTPFVLWLCALFKDRGLKVGIVSRGHGASPQSRPRFVDPDSDPRVVGDEALLLARRGACPVVIHRNRVRAASAMVNRERPDVLVCDDGMQHYRLARDVEIALIDGTVRFRNGLPLPAGPLREPVTRLREVDVVICNGGQPEGNEVPMSLSGDQAVSLDHPHHRRPLSTFRGDVVHAVAGIGRPERFFEHLRHHGLRVQEHPFPDHHAFTPEELSFQDHGAILMTEKDAVKCGSWALVNAWRVPVSANMPAGFGDRLDRSLPSVLRRRHSKPDMA